MLRFLIDEDLPRSLAAALRASGLHADDVRDVGLRGRTDDDVFAHAVAHSLSLLTADLGFSNRLHFKPAPGTGIVIVRYPNETSADVLVQSVVELLRQLKEDDIADSIVIIEPGRFRRRRHEK